MRCETLVKLFHKNILPNKIINYSSLGKAGALLLTRRKQRAYAQHGGELRGKIFLCFKKIMYFCNKNSDGGNL